MGNVNFGSLTTQKKATFNIQSGNQRAQALVNQYNKEWTVFEEAKKAAENAENGGQTQNVNMASIETDLENAIAKLKEYQAAINDANKQASAGGTADDKDEKEKVKGKTLNSMG